MVPTYEGVVENGRIRLPEDVVLPEKAKVYVVVPEAIVEVDKPPLVVRPRSLRLKDPTVAALLKVEVVKENDDAGL